MYSYTFFYRDGGNYKYEFTLDSPKEFAIGQEISYKELGLDQQSFHQIIGTDYDQDLDHDLLEVTGKRGAGEELTNKQLFLANAEIDPSTNTARIDLTILVQLMLNDLQQMGIDELCLLATHMYGVKASFDPMLEIMELQASKNERVEQIF